MANDVKTFVQWDLDIKDIYVSFRPCTLWKIMNNMVG